MNSSIVRVEWPMVQIASELMVTVSPLLHYGESAVAGHRALLPSRLPRDAFRIDHLFPTTATDLSLGYLRVQMAGLREPVQQQVKVDQPTIRVPAS